MANPPPTRVFRLAQSGYNSPYSRKGAPDHPNTDPWAPLRTRALATLEAMGYEPRTMCERGVLWAEDQDPFGHVMQSQFPNYMGGVFIRFMESFEEYLSEQEHKDFFDRKGTMLAVKTFDLDIRRQVNYPDTLIAANRQNHVDPDRNHSEVALFSLKQQAIVAEVKSDAVFINGETGRPVNIKDAGGNWSKLHEGLNKRAERATQLKAKWERENPPKKRPAKPKL